MKKFLQVSMCLAVILAMGFLVACGSNTTDTPSPADNETTSQPEQENTQDEQAQAADEVASAVGAFKIGGTGPLTGGAAIYGNAAKQGAEIAVAEINALGGIQFELKYEDDEHDAEKAINAYNALKDWGMQLFLGSVTSTPGVATSAASNEDRIIFLTPSASSTEVIGGIEDPETGTINTPRKDNVFQMCFIDPAQGVLGAQFISEKYAGKKVAVIYKNDDVYSMGIYNNFKTKSAELGLDIVSTTTFTEGSKTDFSVQLTESKNKGAEIVFLPMYYEPASLIFKQAKDLDYAPIFFGVDGMDGILTMEGFDTSLAEGVVLLTPFAADATDSLTKSFVSAYQEKYGEVPNQFAADGYDCVYAYYHALQKAGISADSSAAEICEALIPLFANGEVTFDGTTGAGMKWDASGAVDKAPKAVEIKDGVYVGVN